MKTATKTDRLPAVVESTTFRKTSGEFTFTIVTPKQHEDLAKAFMERISDLGVFFFRPCKPEEIDEVLKQGDKTLPSPQTLSPEGRGGMQIADVETLSLLLEMTERNVQLQVDNGLLVRTGRGQYDMLASFIALWKAHKELQRGQGDEYNRERTAAMKLRRQEREANYLERIGKLVNAERVGRMIEAAKAGERQALLNMPKNVAPRMDGLSSTEMEIELNDWVYRHLKSQAEVVIVPAEKQEPELIKPEKKKASRAKPQRRKGKKKDKN